MSVSGANWPPETNAVRLVRFRKRLREAHMAAFGEQLLHYFATRRFAHAVQKRHGKHVAHKRQHGPRSVAQSCDNGGFLGQRALAATQVLGQAVLAQRAVVKRVVDRGRDAARLAPLLDGILREINVAELVDCGNGHFLLVGEIDCDHSVVPSSFPAGPNTENGPWRPVITLSPALSTLLAF